MSNQRAELLQAIASAPSLSEQMRLLGELSAHDARTASARAEDRSLDFANTTVEATLSPVRTHERTTVASDWLGDVTASADDSRAAEQKVIAEAAMWYQRTGAMVAREDREEFEIQAEGMGRRIASAYGEQAEALARSFTDYAKFLAGKQAASGLPQVQQLVDAQENPAAQPLNPEVFDNFADEVHPINQGVVGTETSERAPLLQEIVGEGGSGQGAPEVPGGHSTGPDGYDGMSGEDPVGRTSVAINHTMNLDEFRAQAAIEREAASGLPQIEQVVDPEENPAPTPLPTDVAFPWTLGPDAYGNGGGVAKPKEARRRYVAGLMAKDPRQLTLAELHEVRSYTAALNKAADMFGASDTPSPVAGPDPTTRQAQPDYGAGFSEGLADGRAMDAPTFSDNSSHVPPNVKQYTQGFGQGAQQAEQAVPRDTVPSLASKAASVRKISSLLVKESMLDSADFRKGMNYAAAWRPGMRVAAKGSPEFEAGMYAGISDNPHRRAWAAKHAELGGRYPYLAERMAKHAEFTRRTAASLGAKVDGPYMKLAYTSTDLDTMAPGTSPSPTGQTPINGPGTVPVLEGGIDPAAPGGPAPYNGAAPFGAPVVPQSGVSVQPSPADQLVDDRPGGPVDQDSMRQRQLAFRHRVQAGLVRKPHQER